jgi:hypothetical protein
MGFSDVPGDRRMFIGVTQAVETFIEVDGG